MNNKYQRSDDIKNQNRLVYTIMGVSLAILAVLISISVISSRRSPSVLKSEPKAMETEQNENHFEATQAAIELPDTIVADDTDGISDVTPGEKEAADAPIPVEAAAEPTEIIPEFIAVAIGPVSKGYSQDVPVYSMTMDDYRVHRGVDVEAALGADVFAAADGVVSAVWEDPMKGCALRIEHSGGAVSTYYNLSRETVEVMKPGMSVSRGQVIGTVGDTSLVEIADNSHVHYELTVNGEYVDPCAFMTFAPVSEINE